jgi:hypothetical protein
MTFSKFRRILTCGRGKDSTSSPQTGDKPHTETWKEEEGDPFSSLSEVSAPSPVKRVTNEDQQHRESLESNISKTYSQPHLSNNWDETIFSQKVSIFALMLSSRFQSCWLTPEKVNWLLEYVHSSGEISNMCSIHISCLVLNAMLKGRCREYPMSWIYRQCFSPRFSTSHR